MTKLGEWGFGVYNLRIRGSNSAYLSSSSPPSPASLFPKHLSTLKLLGEAGRPLYPAYWRVTSPQHDLRVQIPSKHDDLTRAFRRVEVNKSRLITSLSDATWSFLPRRSLVV
ncbi:unnamed protein product [Cyclocybe aegerita]|uniref:Uncharacterized protein n=1 Tax=Cyclocybe aegerita TaxID=1973307 RepID=A0A8S0W9D1_CYCAE|nr:unnamed protein product [Cyclocybe aegerita]